jgi:formylmethanofuran dehydrogenase subunit E
LLVAQQVELVTPVGDIISHAGRRTHCERCGEEIMNEREVLVDGVTLCRACAQGGYYRV